MEPPRTIGSEEAAWFQLQMFVEDSSYDPGELIFQLMSWRPNLLRIEGIGDPVLTAPVMKRLGRYQQIILQDCAQIFFGTRTVSAFPRKYHRDINLKFVISRGSTNIGVDPNDFLKNLCDAAVGKMSGRQVTIVLIALLVLYFGTTAFENWVAATREMRELEARNAKDVRALEVQAERDRYLSSQETERARLLAEVGRQVPQVLILERGAGWAYRELAKAAASSGGAKVLETDLSGGDAVELLRSPRVNGEGKSLANWYRVAAVDGQLGQVKEGHKFAFHPLDGGAPIIAEVVPVEVPEEQVDVLWKRARDKAPIYVNINAWVVGDRIARAFVMGVGQADQSTAPR